MGIASSYMLPALSGADAANLASVDGEHLSQGAMRQIQRPDLSDLVIVKLGSLLSGDVELDTATKARPATQDRSRHASNFITSEVSK